jgi:RimJ/RimL family protein N-acetyltransferase
MNEHTTAKFSHPGVLQGRHVRLEPLGIEHLDALCEAGLDPELWQLTTSLVRSREEMRRYIGSALMTAEAGTAAPFATVLLETGSVVGSTRFGNMDPSHRRVEIGWTWVARSWQRTAVNTEAKYLMLRHAFEVWQCLRVEFKTDALNTRSRKALARLGAREEGTLRSHMITETGRVRDTVYFSILASEWPGVKKNLEGWQGPLRTRPREPFP